MLCYATLCYAMLCYAMLCYAMLCCPAAGTQATPHITRADERQKEGDSCCQIATDPDWIRVVWNCRRWKKVQVRQHCARKRNQHFRDDGGFHVELKGLLKDPGVL